jgi:hypothetical protein
MRVLILALVFCAFSTMTFAQAQSSFPQKRADDYSKRNLMLERDALAQRQKLDGMLPAWAKQRLETVSKAFLKRMLRGDKTADLSQIVKEEVGRHFKEVSPKQSNILTLYVLTDVVKLLPPHLDKKAVDAKAERDKLKDKKDSISKLSEQDMIMLQQMMEKKNQLETMISNVMKAGFEGGQAAIQALKAS